MSNLIQFLQRQTAVDIIDFPDPRYAGLDLSVNNTDLNSEVTSDSTKLGRYINGFLSDNNANIGIGGYDETRAIYRRSDIFKDDSSPERNIHIGLDIWAPASTKILAPLNGTVHSFQNNDGKGNYGPTIILQHNYKDLTFYTLYGHLDSECIGRISPGQKIMIGEQIGTLGDEAVNGDYPPHLHFQIIDDIGFHQGDYPGVCNATDRDFYLSNCPHPNLLLKLNFVK